MSTQTVSFETLRSLVYTSISSSYAAVGTPFVNPIRLICISNNTDGDMLFSVNGTTDVLFVAGGSFKLFDLCTNRLNAQESWMLPAGTQFYVKQSTAPSKNSVYIEALYGVSPIYSQTVPVV